MQNFIQIFGGFGLFIFGMKMMSDALQRGSSTTLRKILSAMTKNRFLGVLSGVGITSLIQSSSATTVIVVSFVNAGLLHLTEAISVIMGANIGTTLTAWIISFLGFKFKISLFALPAVGVGMFMLFVKSNRIKTWGESIIGFGLLFLGLSFLKKGIPDVKAHPEVFQFLTEYANMGILSVIIFMIIGTIITIIIQSSSATMALTITMAVKGWIPFPMAVAMVIGENIGTTITAVLASIPANKMAKKAALSHAIFNMSGALWILILFFPAIALVDMICPGDPTSKESIKYHLSLFHTMFNCTNTLLLVGFIPVIAKIVSKIIGDDGEESFHLKYITSPIHHSAEIAMIEANKELARMSEITKDMCEQTSNLILNPDKKMGKTIDKIKRYEIITDMLEKEISDFISDAIQTETTAECALELTSILNIVNYEERIGDYCLNLTKLAQRKYDKKIQFNDNMSSKLKQISDEMMEFMKKKDSWIVNKPADQDVITSAKYHENKIDELRAQIKKEHTKSLIEGKGDAASRLILIDMISNLEKIADCCFDITKALTHNIHSM